MDGEVHCISQQRQLRSKKDIQVEADRETAAMEKEREQQVYLARLAEQAERYDGMYAFF